MSDDDYDDYGDDDFDDYGDDDFDDIEEEKKETKQSTKAVTQPSVAVTSSSSYKPASSTSVKISSYDLQRRRQRASDLRKLVNLSPDSGELLSLSKLSPYDFYLRMVKNGTIRQSSQQTKSDNRGVKIQTDSIHHASEACQVPDDLGFSSGSNLNTAANAVALIKFLKRAYPVCETVLEANIPVSEANLGNVSSKATAYSKSYLNLQLPKSLGQREAVAVVPSGRSLSEFLVAYNRPKWAARPSASEGFEGASKGSESKNGNDDSECLVPESGLLCLWDAARSQDIPDKVLVCEGKITSCAMSPDRGEIVVAATREGSVFVWDLREDSQNHISEAARNGGFLSGFRTPSYTTDATVDSAHLSELNQVSILVPGSQSAAHGSSGVASALSVQVASLDSRGIVKVWTVIEMSTVNETGPGADLGMGLGSKIKLIMTATIDTYAPPPANEAVMSTREAGAIAMSVIAKSTQIVEENAQNVGPAAYDFAFLPTDASLVMIASRSGSVLRRSRFGSLPSPAKYAPTRSNPSVRATAIAFSPFQPSLFLVGLSTGDIALYHIDHSEPAMEWPALDADVKNECGRAVLAIRWSTVRACCFFVLCGDGSRVEDGVFESSAKESQHSVLQVWDLSKNVEEPMVRSEVKSDSGAPIGSLAVSTYSPRFHGRHPFIALVDDAGDVQLHMLARDFALSRGDESAALLKFYSTCPNPVVPAINKFSQSQESGSEWQESKQESKETKEADPEVEEVNKEEVDRDDDGGDDGDDDGGDDGNENKE